jgi:hypothetical protein
MFGLPTLRLYRQWKQAAGSYSAFVPTAPFAAFTKNSPQVDSGFISQIDSLAQTLALLLANSTESELVRAGQAAFVLDLPGYLSVAVGYHLQKVANIAPVSLLAAYYQPHAILNGQFSGASLAHYGAKLATYNTEQGVAFLLEGERSNLLPDLALLQYFDNRYLTGLAYFPPLAKLTANGLQTLIDIRPSNAEIPPDLLQFYEQAALAKLNIFEARLPIADLPL